MSSAAAPLPRRPNPVLVLIRVLVVTVAFGILGLGFGGLMGIIGVSIINAVGVTINAVGVTTDMDMALFAGGLPGAVIGLLAGFVVMVRSERQQLRHASERQ